MPYQFVSGRTSVATCSFDLGDPARITRQCPYGSTPIGRDHIMSPASFDFTPLLPARLPPPAVRWTGRVKYDFTGGNNDPDRVPLDGLIAAANAVLRREGRTLATYGLDSGPQGYRPLREFLVRKLEADAGIRCTPDDILMTSGSLQGLDLVNNTLLERGDTVII